MRLIKKSHRHAESIIQGNPYLRNDYSELLNILENITDDDLINDFYNRLGLKRGKSLSKSINHLIKIRLEEEGWKSESKIFKSGSYKHPWRLDFTKGKFSVEVAFNHGEATAWNLMKPVIASEINHVDKEIQTEIGIVVFATSEMKRSGGFDGTVKTFEDFELFRKPLMNYLTVPLLIIGLDRPESFEIKHYKIPGINGKLGLVYKNGERIIPQGEDQFKDIETAI